MTKHRNNTSGAFSGWLLKFLNSFGGWIIIFFVLLILVFPLRKFLARILDMFLPAQPKDIVTVEGTPTITESVAQQLAEKVVTACNNVKSLIGPAGTDEDLLKEVFQSIQNQADLDLLRKVFGERRYFINGSSPLEFLGTLLDLEGWITSELSKSSNTYKYIDEVYRQFNRILG